MGTSPLRANGIVFGAKDQEFFPAVYGCTGDGVTDDSAGIAAMIAAATTAAANGPVHIIFPPGKYRYANTSPTGGAAIVISGLSNVVIEFMHGAELVMDNLTASNGNGHGILVKGSGDNIKIINPRIRWASVPNRSNGDGVRCIGYPSDSAPPGGWLGSSGLLSNITVVNSYVKNAPQTGMIFMGCSDVTVLNHFADSTKADGLHFNACRRVNVLGVRGVNTGDDSLAFVTYYDAVNTWLDATVGPFAQPSVGAFSNADSTATNVISKSCTTNALRIAGSYHVSVSNLAADAPNIGITVDAGIAGGGHAQSYQASVGCLVENATIESPTTYGVLGQVWNTDFSGAAGYYSFDIAFRNVTVRNAGSQQVLLTGNGTTNSGVSGFSFSGLRLYGSNSAQFLGMRNCTISDLLMDGGGSLYVFGQQVSDSSAMSTRARNNLSLGNITLQGGGTLFLQDIRGMTADRFRVYNANSTALNMTRVLEAEIGAVDIDLPLRSGGTSVSMITLAPVQASRFGRITINHDSTSTTPVPLTIGGGSATDVTSDLRMERITYRNGYNVSTSGVVVQGGGFAPIRWFYDLEFYNGGEASPVWRHERIATGVINSLSGSSNTVTQATSITTAVTLNAQSGVITTVSSTLAAGSTATFTVNNTCVAAGSVPVVTLGAYSGTLGATQNPLVSVSAVAAGSFNVTILNAGSGALAGTMKINFSLQ